MVVLVTESGARVRYWRTKWTYGRRERDENREGEPRKVYWIGCDIEIGCESRRRRSERGRRESKELRKRMRGRGGRRKGRLAVYREKKRIRKERGKRG